MSDKNFSEIGSCLKPLSEFPDLPKKDKAEEPDTEGWITDRLPEKSGNYLVTYRTNGKRMLKVEQRFFTGYIFAKGNSCDIVAWKPLPKPYKPKNEARHPRFYYGYDM